MAEFKGIPIATTGVRSGEKYQTPQGFTAIRDGIKVQGEAVRLMYLHVPVVSVAYMASFLAAFASGTYLTVLPAPSGNTLSAKARK